MSGLACLSCSTWHHQVPAALLVDGSCPSQICESFFTSISRDVNQIFKLNEINQIQDCPVLIFSLRLMLISGSSHRSFEVIGLKGSLHLGLDLSWSCRETECNLSGPWVVLKIHGDASDPWLQHPLVLDAGLLSVCLSVSLITLQPSSWA